MYKNLKIDFTGQWQSYSNCMLSLFCLCHTKRILFHTDKWLEMVTVLHNSLCCNPQIVFIKHVQEFESNIIKHLFQNWFTNTIQQLLTFLFISKIRQDRVLRLTLGHQPGNRPLHVIHWAFTCDLHNLPIRLDVGMCQKDA